MKSRIMLAMAAAAMTAQAAKVDSSNVAQPKVMTVLVYDYAAVPDGVARNLEHRTGEIMSKVGVKLKWIPCGSSRTPVQDAECSARLESAHLVLRILAGCVEGSSRSGEVLGAAVTPGNYATLCVAQILHLEKANWVDRGRLMPYAAAHEIGHLLLGPAHGSLGIMRGVWGKADFQAMERMMFDFSAREAQTMRESVSLASSSLVTTD